ncbi:hypothetical protein BIWAKO_04110 [Bosea sp. BIWAKO-01]|nr:hypothetical protein BIWAKO_04110 [Bosea sp. BIWAKO-01]
MARVPLSIPVSTLSFVQSWTRRFPSLVASSDCGEDDCAAERRNVLTDRLPNQSYDERGCRCGRASLHQQLCELRSGDSPGSSEDGGRKVELRSAECCSPDSPALVRERNTGQRHG